MQDNNKHRGEVSVCFLHLQHRENKNATVTLGCTAAARGQPTSEVGGKVDEKDGAHNAVVEEAKDAQNRLREDVQRGDDVEEDEAGENDQADAQKPRDALSLPIDYGPRTVTQEGGEVAELIHELCDER